MSLMHAPSPSPSPASSFRRPALPGLLLWLVLAAAAFLFFATGTLSRLPLAEWPDPFSAPQAMSMDQLIFVHALLPRTAVALLAGAALGLAGALLQAVLRNPIADASTLGIAAGAQLAIVAATLLFPAFLDGNRQLTAFLGAGLAAAMVFGLGARQRFEPVTMVVAGMLIAILCSGLAAALTLSRGEYLMSLAIWNGGSLSQQDWSPALWLAGQLALYGVLAALAIRPLVMLDLGDTSARALGVNLGLVRLLVALIAVGLSAMVAAAVGLVGFVGLAAPALVRAAGIRRRAAVLAASPLMGALLLWLCDGMVQTLAVTGGDTFPTGSVVALLGGPLILFLLVRMRHTSLASGMTAGHAPAASPLRSPLAFLLVCGGLIAFAVLSLFLARTGQNWTGPNWTGQAWIWLDPASFAGLLPFRLPRMAAAAAAGGLLALSGAILQRMTGNPMASPEVLGVSGGAGTGYALSLLLLPAAGSWQLLGGSLAGAMVALLMVLAFALRRNLAPERLLLAGIAVSAFCSALLAALVATGNPRAWQILAWLGGTAASATPETAAALILCLALALGASLLASRWLTILPLGQAVPLSLGLPLRASRGVLILVAALATAAASLLVGPLSFAGLIAPHIVSRAGIRRTPGFLAGSALLGAALMAMADFGARTAAFPYELPLGLFASMAGTPYLIWLMARKT
ncbi:Fe(3+)-hydroxamate ABC transporter permease FhuB [Pannonibacter indicus]|uniref:ABC-type Fe3+-siderophore transport system, permease component n=1 Tax=Pannonibacter indicus TaxID=466044 RepID=A0A0K6I729_9HYPH|nr:Fe(3+)-hydroxamate ABC transporter permease FhuB [Pannonibacter indicus]CUA99082.1 ABC-type Fe3+-siderophore transport system, permease component [Pannonibacter indicus]